MVALPPAVILTSDEASTSKFTPAVCLMLCAVTVKISLSGGDLDVDTILCWMIKASSSHEGAFPRGHRKLLMRG